MSKFKFAITFAAVFALPSILYFVANFYWWLFDGNVLNGDKMFSAAMFALGAGVLTALIAGIERDLL